MSSRNDHSRPTARRAIVALILTATASAAQAVELETPVSPSPVGSGARAAGMANAFVAVADDATAASWNPAGLVQLERPEFSIVGSYNTIREDFKASADHPEVFSTHESDSFDINFISFVYPLPVFIGERNATVSLSYQQKYDLSRSFDFDFTILDEFDDPPITLVDEINFRWRQEGSLGAITPAFAMELTHRLSVGVAVNFWRDNPFADNEFTQTSLITDIVTINGVTGDPIETFKRDEYKNIKGENFVIGLLWNATERFTIGLRYDTAFTADADYSFVRTSTQVGGDDAGNSKRELNFPDTWSFGLALRVNDRLTMAFDGSFTDWNDFTVKTADGDEFSLVDGSEINDEERHNDFDMTKTFRLGAEYVFLPKEPQETLPRLWSLRGGLFYDEEPASGRPSGDLSIEGDGEPDRFYGFTLGAGLLMFQRLNIDVAYQLRYGNGVNSDFLRGVPGYEQDFLQHRILLSTVLYF